MILTIIKQKVVIKPTKKTQKDCKNVIEIFLKMEKKRDYHNNRYKNISDTDRDEEEKNICKIIIIKE